MSIRYPGYFEAVARRENNRQQIYLRTYAAFIGTGTVHRDMADSVAMTALAHFDKQFPAPVWPGDEDD